MLGRAFHPKVSRPAYRCLRARLPGPERASRDLVPTLCSFSQLRLPVEFICIPRGGNAHLSHQYIGRTYPDLPLLREKILMGYRISSSTSATELTNCRTRRPRVFRNRRLTAMVILDTFTSFDMPYLPQISLREGTSVLSMMGSTTLSWETSQ